MVMADHIVYIITNAFSRLLVKLFFLYKKETVENTQKMLMKTSITIAIMKNILPMHWNQEFLINNSIFT